MACEWSSVSSVVRNESPLAYDFHCAMHCLNLSASAAVKASAIQNAENVARKVVKMFTASARKTALLKCCITEDVSSQEEAQRYLSCRLMRFVERHALITALVAEAGVGPQYASISAFKQRSNVLHFGILNSEDMSKHT